MPMSSQRRGAGVMPLWLISSSALGVLSCRRTAVLYAGFSPSREIGGSFERKMSYVLAGILQTRQQLVCWEALYRCCIPNQRQPATRSLPMSAALLAPCK